MNTILKIIKPTHLHFPPIVLVILFDIELLYEMI